MPAYIVLGLQGGDEGKGKMVDFLILRHSPVMVVRYGGGDNAGHSHLLLIDGRLVSVKTHTIPSTFEQKTIAAIGPGVAFSPKSVMNEITMFEAYGISIRDRLFVDGRAPLNLPHHRVQDLFEEDLREHLGQEKIGTTGRGIGPTFESQVARNDIRVSDMLHPQRFRELLQDSIDMLLDRMMSQDWMESDDPVEPMKKILPYLERISESEARANKELLDAGRLAPRHVDFTQYYDSRKGFNLDVLIDHMMRIAGKIEHTVTDVPRLVREHMDRGDMLVFEGAQGASLDVTYKPDKNRTSSHPGISGATLAGINFRDREDLTVVGVVKAYRSRVGSDNFPTKLTGEQYDYLMEKGSEFGATTGRKRDLGYVDLAELRTNAMIEGPDEIAITRFDVISGMPGRWHMGIGYRANGTEFDMTPIDRGDWASAEAILEEVPGFNDDFAKISDFDSFSPNAQAYGIKIGRCIQEVSRGARLRYIGIGPEPDQIIEVPV